MPFDVKYHDDLGDLSEVSDGRPKYVVFNW